MKKITFFMLFLLVFVSENMFSQVSINETFDGTTTPTGWTYTSFSRSTTAPCTGAGALRRNFWSSGTTGNVQTPTWSSNAQDLTISFDYKILQYASGTPTVATPNTPDWGDFFVEVSVDGGTTYTITAGQIDNTNHVVSTSCANKSYTVSGSSLPNANTIRVRFRGVWQSGSGTDYFFYLDNVVLTQNSVTPPNCTTGFSPANNATGVARNATLSWNAEPSATSYDVYFGTSTPATFIGNQTGTTYTPALMAANTMHYWRIVPKNVNGDAVGCTDISFQTGANFVYCLPTNSSGCSGDNIAAVVLESLSDSGMTCTPNYEDRSSVQNAIPNLTQAGSSTLSLTMGTDSSQYNAVWIDFNQNGTFETTEYFSLGTNAGASGVQNIPINIPGTATLGNTKMRIRGGNDSQTTNSQACGAATSGWGSSRDYTVNIVAPSTDAMNWNNMQWLQTSATNGSNTSLTAEVGVPVTAYTRGYEPGVTDAAGQGAGVQVWIGYSTTNADPATFTNWVVATYNQDTDSNSNDEYQADLNLPVGTYYVASRWKLNTGAYTYGGYNNFYSAGGQNIELIVTPVQGDLCSNPVPLTLGTTLQTSNSLATNSTETPLPSCGGYSTTHEDMWYSITVPSNATAITVETSVGTGTPLLTDTVMAAYSGTCGALTALDCNDDNVGFYSGLNLTGLTPGSTILVRVSGYSGAQGNFAITASATPCASTTVWDGSTWSLGAPDITMKAELAGNYSGTGFSACTLDVTGTAVANIPSGETLIIDGAVTVAATATLEFEDNAYLVQNQNVANTGTAIVNKNSAPIKRLDYTGWSSPVDGQNLLAFSPATVTTRFYTYDPTNDGSTTDAWDWADPANNSFTPGRGYLVRAPNNWSSTTASAYPGVFTGTLNNGDVTFNLAEAGINMVGNPYASPINGTDFINAHNGTLGTTTLYFWTHTAPSNTTTGIYPTNNYASYTTAGGTAAAAGGATPDGIINVGQGFLLDTPTAGDVVFTNAMREASGAGQFFRTANVERHRMWFNLTSPDALHNQMLIAYMDGADNGIDNADGKMFGNSSSAIYSTLNNEMYVIQGRALPFNNADEVPMGFTATTAGSYTIDLGQTDGIFADNQEVYLRDNLLNVVHDIKSSAYTFASAEGEFLNRFDVIYTNSTLTVATPEFTENSVVLYTSNGMLQVNSGAVQMQSIKVYDVQGRVITTKTNINNTQVALEGFTAKQQVLLVEITSTEGVTITKKYVF